MNLHSSSVDCAIFCLSLMGTNYRDFIVEANRILRKDGVLWIAEVSSRIDDCIAFTKEISEAGFRLTEKNTSNSHFSIFRFTKSSSTRLGFTDASRVRSLRPCVYKKR